MNLYTVRTRITEAQLKTLCMLAEWQLRELGIDPQSVNEAYRAYEDHRESEKLKAWLSREAY